METSPWYSRHLVETGESYLTHAAFALRIAVWCALASVVIVIHALLPFLFENTGSRLLCRIDAALKARRPPPSDGAA